MPSNQLINKKKYNVVFQGPILNRSGYGVASDLLFHAIKSYPLFGNVSVIPTTWGACADRLTEQIGDDIIKSHIPDKQIEQPHVHIFNGIPHHIKKSGTIFNINLCAGIETTECHDDFMKGVNDWDLNIVYSQHAKNGYLNSIIKPVKPIEVLHFYADNNAFNSKPISNDKINSIMSQIKEPEAFLFVGQITHPQLYCDRKDSDSLIKSFCELFKGKPNKPALILKTGGTTYSTFDRDNTIERIKRVKADVPDNDVNVYLVHGELNNEEMASLYKHPKVIAGISFTHGEGFCLPLMEFSLIGKPIIASDWSAHTEFLDDRFIPLRGNIGPIPDYLASEHYKKGSQWFTIDYEKAEEAISKFYYNKDYRTEMNNKAVSLAIDNANKYNREKFEYRLHRILDKYLS